MTPERNFPHMFEFQNENIKKNNQSSFTCHLYFLFKFTTTSFIAFDRFLSIVSFFIHSIAIENAWRLAKHIHKKTFAQQRIPHTEFHQLYTSLLLWLTRCLVLLLSFVLSTIEIDHKMQWLPPGTSVPFEQRCRSSITLNDFGTRISQDSIAALIQFDHSYAFVFTMISVTLCSNCMRVHLSDLYFDRKIWIDSIRHLSAFKWILRINFELDKLFYHCSPF